MNWVDYFIIGIIVVSTLVSLLRGFVREALSLAVWVLAFGVGWAFHADLAPAFARWISTPSIQLGAAFGLLVVLTLILGGIVNYLIGRLIDETGLSGTDRVLGMAFGVARGALVVGVLVLLACATPLPSDPWWRESVLLPRFEDLAAWLRDFLPKDVQGQFKCR